MIYSGDGGREGVGGIKGGSGNGNGIKGVSGVWGDRGDGNGRQVRQPVSGGTDGGIRDCGGKGNSGWRNRARAVSGRKGGRVGSFGLSTAVRAAV